MASRTREEREARRKRVAETQAPPAPVAPSERTLNGKGLRLGASPDPDELRIEGQNFIVLSFVSPHGPQKCPVTQTKFRGVFATEEAAKQHARKVFDRDPDFDVHIVKMGHWVPTPPPDEMKDSIRMEYENNEKLNKIMQHHYDQMDRQRQRMAEKKKKITQHVTKKLAAAASNE